MLTLYQKIEEIVRIELTGNGIVISGDLGAGKYLYSDGSTVFWNSPGDVYLTQTQTLTNKTIESSIISGSSNTITNIPNSALVNSGISVNGVTIPLGGSVSTPDNNTTYTISAQDGVAATEKIIRLADNAGVNGSYSCSRPPASIPAGQKAVNLSIDRTGNLVTLSATAEDDDTITTLQAATGGTAQTGAMVIAASGSSLFHKMLQPNYYNRFLLCGYDYRLRATTGQVFSSGDFTFLATGASTVTQGVDGNGDATITVDSTDTITSIKGGSTGIATTGNVTFLGGTNVTVSQSGTDVTIDSVDTNTVPRLASGSNSVQAGDFLFTSSGATNITQSTNAGVTTIEISSTNTDTGASLTAGSGLTLTGGTEYSIKNAANLTGNTLVKWDSGNSQLADSIITDDGSAVTIGGDLVVQGTQTVLETTVLQVADNEIELRKGNGLVGSDGGLRLNRTSNPGNGNITSFTSLQWYESGGYWRVFDGSVDRRLVTETETQILTNKTLNSPTLNNPSIGAATATSINGLDITSTASATLTVASAKTLEVQRDLVLTSDNSASSITTNLRQGGNVAYTSDTLASFAATTATQIRGVITETTGTGDLVFATNPIFETGLRTSSTGFNLINSGATNIQFGGVATQIDIGADTGTTTIRHDLVVEDDLTVGTTSGDNFTCNATFNSANADIQIRGGATDPMRVGRGVGSVNTNTVLGVRGLNSVTSGSQNTSIGFESLLTVNAGAANTAIGNRVLRATGVGDKNVGIGSDVMLVNLSGSKNVGIGNNSLETLSTGDANVCIGHYAGYGALGTGNVLIGPADDENSTNATFQPPNVSGNRQLVIGSGTEYWIQGDSTFNVTLNNNVTVNNDMTVRGDLVVEGVTTSVESNIVQIADKNIELASVVSTTFSAVCVDGTPNLTGVTPTSGLIPGMEVTTGQVGITIPANTVIQSITGNAIVLSANIVGSGTVTFNGIGPSDLSADGGGLTVKGGTDKTFQWRGIDGGVTYNAWTSSEHMDLATGKKFRIGSTDIASETQIGPATGTLSLGAGVTTSSLTSLGTLTALNVNGNIDCTGTGYLQLPSGTDAQRPGSPAEGMLRWNDTSNTFEGYDGTAWGALGGGGGGGTSIANGTSNVSVAQDSDITITRAGVLKMTVKANDIRFGNMRVRVNDGGKFEAGDQSDLLMYHDGSSAYLENATGNTLNRIPASGIFAIQKTGGTENIALFNADGACELFHNNVKRLDTTLTGVTVTGNLEPSADDTDDLGSSTKRWANIYSADLQLSNEGKTNDVDGTWGTYTIQEGEDDLFLINRRSGKKYKFMLQEVQ